ncbi:MAG TPA: sulfatase, partial [Rhodopirellula sp.]|nr:sulfatase [Rhodopirellula sp.]
DDLYPLEQYLDAADTALDRDPKNLNQFVKWLNDDDEGMRWWGVVGLHLLGDQAEDAKPNLSEALTDDTDEIRIMAAWTLVNLGDSDTALANLESMLFRDPAATNNTTLLHNVLDWMGEPALPLVKKYIDRGGNRQGKYGIGILGRIAQLNGW